MKTWALELDKGSLQPWQPYESTQQAPETD